MFLSPNCYFCTLREGRRKTVLILDKITLHHFRNYAEQAVDFTPGVNLISGPNGHGKTNLLEALHYVCLAHSQRTRKDKDLIRWSEKKFTLRAQGHLGVTEHIQSVEFSETGEKRVKVDGTESKKLSDLIGNFHLISFGPEDIDLLKGAPALRRRFLDSLLCQYSPEYLSLLRRYNQTLKQRNSLLKQMPRFDSEVFAAYSQELLQTGSKITYERKLFIEQLAPLAVQFNDEIVSGPESLQMEISTEVSAALDLENIQADMAQKMAALRHVELEQRNSLIGPHREDLLFFLSGKLVRDFGSQGQKRSISLSLKLAAAALLEQKIGKPPILLLDDVFSELDENRRLKIGQIVQSKAQVFIANPRIADLPFDVQQIITVHNGQVKL